MDLEPSPYGDFVLPFDIAKCGVRGRLVRLASASARALGAHALPEPAARVAVASAGGRKPITLSTKPLSTLAPLDDELDDDVTEAVTA